MRKVFSKERISVKILISIMVLTSLDMALLQKETTGSSETLGEQLGVKMVILESEEAKLCNVVWTLLHKTVQSVLVKSNLKLSAVRLVFFLIVLTLLMFKLLVDLTLQNVNLHCENIIYS